MKFSFMQSEKQAARRSSAMSLQVCPATTLNSGRSSQQVESACHIPDAQSDHRCLTEDECGLMQPLVGEDHAAWLATAGYGCSYDPPAMSTFFLQQRNKCESET
ncbi:hypothetical protein CK203_006706 [Vitis vinifera]|uniref:Uncharacterized protein n=1 Tax=Vitis vinifera TaxID=29760 RepID=A0A438KAH8_VITVI|nr:hypothetical protein CK203_006706 [Vitis vinifera]